MKPFCFGCLIPLIIIIFLGMVLVRRVYTPADVELGLKHLEDVKRFNAVFPNHFERISGMGLFFGNEGWSSGAIVFDRYLISMSFELKIDMIRFSRGRVLRNSDLRFTISEAHDNPRYDGASSVLKKSTFRSFDDFPEMRNSSDLFRIMGIDPVVNSPVAGFEKWANKAYGTVKNGRYEPVR